MRKVDAVGVELAETLDARVGGTGGERAGVLRGLADYLDLSLGDLLEGITLHALEGKAPFSAETLAHVKRFKTVHGLTLTAKDSHQLVEEDDDQR